MFDKKTKDILLNGINTKDRLLHLFSSYIASDPDFKYNDTYLIDQIDSFLEDYRGFTEKRNIFNDIKDYIEQKTINGYTIEVLFDESFCYPNDGAKENYVNFSLLKKKNSFILKLTLLDKATPIEYSYEITKDSSMHFDWKLAINDFLDLISKLSDENDTKNKK